METQKIKRTLFDRYPFFGTLIDIVPYIETRNCVDFNGNPTAATDGGSIYYHPDFINKITEEECIFACAHEIVHIAFDHINRGKGKNQKMWNIAADAVTNAFLKKDGFQLIKGAVNIRWAKNYDVEEVYRRLLKKKKSQEGEKQQDVGHDTHRFWNEKKIETPNEELLKELQKKFIELGEKEVFKKKSPSELKELLEKAKQVLKKSSKKEDYNSTKIIGIGMDTESKSVKFESVGIHEPLVNWPLVLKKPVEIVNLDWSYQNATIEDGVVSASLEESSFLKYYETELLFDTSGSISDELLRAFLRECKCIMNFSKLKVGCFDTKFYGFKEIRSIRDINEFTFVGRGGTNFDVAIKAFSKKATEKIIFTDGEAFIPGEECNVIWVVFGKERINPKGGKVIYVEKEKLLHLSRKEKVLEKRWEK